MIFYLFFTQLVPFYQSDEVVCEAVHIKQILSKPDQYQIQGCDRVSIKKEEKI